MIGASCANCYMLHADSTEGAIMCPTCHTEIAGSKPMPEFVLKSVLCGNYSEDDVIPLAIEVYRLRAELGRCTTTNRPTRPIPVDDDTKED